MLVKSQGLGDSFAINFPLKLFSVKRGFKILCKDSAWFVATQNVTTKVVHSVKITALGKDSRQEVKDISKGFMTRILFSFFYYILH